MFSFFRIEGTVSHGPTAHLLTASDDNSISVVRMGSWQVEKTLYNHSAGVTALVLHPSGKLAFSCQGEFLVSSPKDSKMNYPGYGVSRWGVVSPRPGSWW